MNERFKLRHSIQLGPKYSWDICRGIFRNRMVKSTSLGGGNSHPPSKDKITNLLRTFQQTFTSHREHCSMAAAGSYVAWDAPGLQTSLGWPAGMQARTPTVCHPKRQPGKGVVFPSRTAFSGALAQFSHVSAPLKWAATLAPCCSTGKTLGTPIFTRVR